jgi:transcriptional regulator with XRE-family HTH domain
VKSHRLLKQIFKKKSVQRIADRMNLSPSTLYKWAEAKDTGSASGIPNPLDRALNLYRATGDPLIIRWLCEQAGGFFVENAEADKIENIPMPLAPATSKVVKQFADLLSTVAGAASDSKINLAEARRIRKEWENLKRVAEGYVKYCEDGNFKRLKSDLGKLK